MSWEDIETSMQQAVVDASGLAPDKVIWSYQNVDEPALDFIVIHFGGEIVVGVDRVNISTNLSRPAGQEIEQEIRGVREVPFQLTCYTTERQGETAARRLAEKVRTKFRLPSIRYNLRKVGLAPFDPGPVQYIPDLPSTNFRGRAICTIRCYVPVMDCVEYTGYIARVRGTWIAYGAGTQFASGFTGAFDSALATGSPLRDFWSMAAVPGAYDATFIYSLTNARTGDGFAGSYAFQAGDGTQYAYLAIPQAWGMPSTFRDVNTSQFISFTGVASGVMAYGTLYNIWRSPQANTSAFTYDVE